MKNLKKSITLIEILIVLFLIALITGVVAYNYRGSLDEGRAFTTERNIQKIKEILGLELAKQPFLLDKPTLERDWRDLLLKKSPLVKDLDSLTRDGWGNPLTLTVEPNGELTVTSQRYLEYRLKETGPSTMSPARTHLYPGGWANPMNWFFGS